MNYSAHLRWPEQPRDDIIAAKREISRVFADIEPQVQQYVPIADVVEQLRAREHTRAAAHWAIFELERDGLIQRCFIEDVEHMEQKRDAWPIDFDDKVPEVIPDATSRAVNPPRLKRNLQWYAWYYDDAAETHKSHAKIRDKWNRDNPRDRIDLGKSDTGRGVVKQGIKAAAKYLKESGLDIATAISELSERQK